jgi:hypothetical protein
VSQARQALGAERAGTLEVNAVGKNYAIEVRLFSGSELVTSVQQRCDICTMAEALQTVERAASAAAGKLKASVPSPKPGEPGPAGASKQAVSPGDEDSGSAQAGTPGSSMAGASLQRGRSWPLWPGIVAGGAGLTALAIGIPLVAIDGNGTNCRGEPRSDYRNCEDLYDTAAGGWVLTTMGLAGLTASGVLFYLHFTSKPDERATEQRASVEWINAAPLPDGGVAVGAGGRF